MPGTGRFNLRIVCLEADFVWLPAQSPPQWKNIHAWRYQHTLRTNAPIPYTTRFGSDFHQQPSSVGIAVWVHVYVVNSPVVCTTFDWNVQNGINRSGNNCGIPPNVLPARSPRGNPSLIITTDLSEMIVTTVCFRLIWVHQVIAEGTVCFWYSGLNDHFTVLSS